ncbi:hypothetical protein B0H19DRAFT_1232639 [Mycena capillaripes]|nr:hypothetical protein B0H19DRAFT_1232639 [Mycena capillaripes]
MVLREKSMNRSHSIKRRLSRLWQSKPREPLTSVPPLGLPTDIFREIANHLTKLEIINLSGTCKELRALLLPEIYTEVSLLCGSRACSLQLEMLSRSPNLWTYIRKFEIGPDWLSWPLEAAAESWAAAKVEKISPGLTNLHTFAWHGLRPLPESVWRALRKSCTELKNLAYTAQLREFEPESELFKFRNLRQFSFVAKQTPAPAPLVKPGLPTQLCDMVLENPDLEQLSLQLCESNNNLGQVSRLMHGAWQNLSSFHIQICPTSPSHNPPSDELSAFLTSHSSITTLSVLTHLPDIPPLLLGPTALPRLTSFTGVSAHVAALPQVDSLSNLVVVDEEPTDPSSFLAALRRLTSLTSLKLYFADAAHPYLLRQVISACLNLQTLDFTYATPCNLKQLKPIAVALSHLPWLRNVTFTKTYRLADGTMLSAALLLLAHNPDVQKIDLHWVTTKAWKQSGQYTVQTQRDAPDALEAKEFGPRALGGSFTRRFRYVLEGGDTLSKGLARMRL